MQNDTGTVTPPRREPMFNVPGVVLAMLAVMLIVHASRQFLSVENVQLVILALAFIPDRYSAHPLDWPGGALAAWTSPITHMAVHGDWGHLALNGASLAAFGGLVARRIGAWRFFLFTMVCGIAGAFAFAALNVGVQAPLIGASGAISGMMAASLRIVFSAIDSAPDGSAGALIRRAPHLIAVKSLSQTLQDRRLQVATGVWLFINLLAAYGLGTPAQAGVVAWEAHLGGYFAGLLLFGLFDVSRPQTAVMAQTAAINPHETD